MIDLYGIPVIVAPGTPRYQLPAEVAPGIPWPAGFREEINTWAEDFLGKTYLVKPDEVLVVEQYGSLPKKFIMHPETYAAMRRAVLAKKY